MKIDELNQQIAPNYLTGSRVEKQPETADTHSEVAARQSRPTDTVKLSDNLPAATEARQPQAMRAGRVEEIKSQIANGTYSVSADDVAKKMLSKIVLPSTD